MKKKWFEEDDNIPAVPKSQKMVAKKDFAIHWNDYHREIKKGEDISDIPEMFHQNLKTEEVI